MESETIMALIALGAVIVSFISVLTTKAQIAASITIAERQVNASAEIAQKQIRAQLVSTNRQKWIDTLRTHIVDLLSASTVLAKALHHGHDPKEEITCLDRACQTVALHLNPNDELHKTLSRTLNDLAICSIEAAKQVLSGKKTPTEAYEPTDDATSVGKMYFAIHKAGHAVLSAESELIQRGE